MLTASNFSQQTYPYYAAGVWHKKAVVQQVRNPWSGDSLASVSVATKSDVQDILEAANTSFLHTCLQLPLERKRILSRIAQGIQKLEKEFVATIVSEAGKPLHLAQVEVTRAISTFQIAAIEAQAPDEDISISTNPAGGMSHHGLLRRFPLGVILGITPFNFPLNLVAHKIAPAIASGNCIILKPSPRTPLSALLLAKVIHSAGVVPGQVNIVPFDHSLVKNILADCRVRMLSFTGGSLVGWNLKGSLPVRTKVTLELGGNAAVIVEPDANWREAVPAIAASAFAFAGQSCISTQRIFVHASIYPSFRKELVIAATSMYSGDPRLPVTTVGPLIDQAARNRVLHWVEQATQEGAMLLTPIVTQGLSLLKPILIEAVRDGLLLESQEVFGPVATLQSYSDISEAFTRVNASDYGLQASIFTKNTQTAQSAFRTLETGTVLINEIPSFRVENMPYGGIKASGFGREGIRYAMLEMTEPKLFIEKL